MVTRPDAPAGRGRRVEASPVASARRGGGARGAHPGPGPRPGVPRPAARDRPGLLPGGRVRGAAAAGRAGHPAARLGQPALLHPAGLAGRRAGPARHPARRRRDRRQHVPDRQGAGRGPGVRGAHRAGAARRHDRHAARPALAFGGRTARRDAGRDRGRHGPGRPAAGRGRELRSQDHPGRRARGLEAARARGGPADPRRAPPIPGAWTELDGVRLKLGPVSLDALAPIRTSAPASCRPAATRCSSAPAPARYASATSRPRASAA